MNRDNNHIILVTVAAGFIGFCGEGISGALMSGKLLAEAILGNLMDPAAVLAAYTVSSQPLRERIHHEHELGALIPVNTYQLYTMLPDQAHKKSKSDSPKRRK